MSKRLREIRGPKIHGPALWIAEEWKSHTPAGCGVGLVTDFRDHSPGDQRLERLATRGRACLRPAKEVSRKIDRGAHKSIKARPPLDVKHAAEPSGVSLAS